MRAVTLLLVTLLLLLSACKLQEAVQPPQERYTTVGIVAIKILPPPNESPAAAASSLEIVSPTAGEELTGGKVTIRAKVENFDLVSYTTNRVVKAGQGHLHFYLDGGAYSPTYVTSYTYTGVKPGEHTVRVVLANNDHTELDVVKSVTFVMK